MNIFTKKGFLKKLIIIIIAITIFSTIIQPKVTYAAEDVVTKLGGSLLSPVASLMIGLGDAAMNLLHDIVYDMESSYILVSNKSGALGIILTILAAAAAIIVIALLAYWTGGAALTLLAKIGAVAAGTTLGVSAVGSIVAVSLTAGAVAGTLTAIAWFGDNVMFPLYQISPEEIFKGEVALLDVNFFNPKKVTKKTDRNVMVSEKIESKERWLEELDKTGVGEINPEMEASFNAYSYPGMKYDAYSATSANGKGLKQIFDKINEKYGAKIIRYNTQSTGWTFTGTVSSENQNEHDENLNAININKVNGTLSIFDDKDELTFLVTYAQETKRYESGAESTWKTDLTVDIYKSGTVNVFRKENEVDLDKKIITNKVSVLQTNMSLENVSVTQAGNTTTTTNLTLSSLEDGENYINEILNKYGYNKSKIKCVYKTNDDEQKLEWNDNYEATFTTKYENSYDQHDVYTVFKNIYTLKITKNGEDVLDTPVKVIYSKKPVSGASVTDIRWEESTQIEDTAESLQKVLNDKINSMLQNYNYNEEINIFSADFWQNNDKIFKWSNGSDAYQAQLKKETHEDYSDARARKSNNNNNIFFRYF